MKTDIRHKWQFAQAPELVWEYLTKADLIATWLMPNDFLPVVGHEFEFTTNPIPPLKLNGHFYCKVLKIVPLKKLVYTWKGGLSKDEITLDTLVEWTLIVTPSGTELRLVHSGFDASNQAIHGAMTGGWNKHIESMLGQLQSV